MFVVRTCVLFWLFVRLFVASRERSAAIPPLSPSPTPLPSHSWLHYNNFASGNVAGDRLGLELVGHRGLTWHTEVMLRSGGTTGVGGGGWGMSQQREASSRQQRVLRAEVRRLFDQLGSRCRLFLMCRVQCSPSTVKPLLVR